MAQSLNSTLGDTSNPVSILYDTEVPELIDPANIVEAFVFYHYGGDYNGVGTPDGVAGHLNNLNNKIDQHAAASTNIHGLIPADGEIVATNKTQNLSNKNLVSPTLSGSTTISGSLSVSSNTTIAGNLTVDTDGTLFVDSANNKVGVGSTSISSSPARLVIEGTAGTAGQANKIDLSSGTYGFGISSGQLNHVSAGAHAFWAGGSSRATINGTTGVLSVTNPAVGETGARNITVSTTVPTTQGSNGDVWLVYI
jgi:hypothetical protein